MFPGLPFYKWHHNNIDIMRESLLISLKNRGSTLWLLLASTCILKGELVNLWTDEPSDRWTFRQMNLRTDEPSDRWTFGQMNLRANEQSPYWSTCIWYHNYFYYLTLVCCYIVQLTCNRGVAGSIPVRVFFGCLSASLWFVCQNVKI